MRLFRRTPDPEPDAGAYYFALMYAVSLRQRRTETGERAFTWVEIHRLSRFPGSVPQCIVAVTLHMDDLERMHYRRALQQKMERTTPLVTPGESTITIPDAAGRTEIKADGETSDTRA